MGARGPVDQPARSRYRHADASLELGKLARERRRLSFELGEVGLRTLQTRLGDGGCGRERERRHAKRGGKTAEAANER
jgi:hypothetical protein